MLSSGTQHVIILEASRIRQKGGTQCLNTRFPLPTLMCAGYSMKLIFFIEVIFNGVVKYTDCLNNYYA